MRSVSPTITWPPSIRPGGLIMRIMASAIVLLPEPDSPTMPSFSPAFSVKLTSSSAFARPASV